jgi:PST family polysaccharide transporter
LTNLFKRSVRATVWALTGEWTVRLLGLASTIVLARLLTPADFGVVAVATGYLALVQGLATFNVAQALIKLRDESPQLLNTAWTLSVVRGLILTLLVIASSGAAANFVGDASVAPVIQVVGLLPLIGGLSNPKFVIFEKRIEFSRLALVQTSTKIIAVAVTIGAAFAMRSYWAIVVGTFIGATARTVLTYTLTPYVPRLSLAHAKGIFAFSGWLGLANALNTISSTLDSLIIARFLGVRDAGLYTMSRQITALTNDGFLAPLERVLFAGFAEIAADKNRLSARVLEVVGMISSIAVPCTIGLALVASELVPLVLGSQWLACVPFLQTVLPFFAVSMVVTSATPAAMAAGANQQVFSTALYFGVLRLPIFVAGVAYFGFAGAMYALALVSVIWWILNFRLLNIAVSINLPQIATAVHRQLISAAVMAGVVMSAPLILTSTSPSWGLLLTKVALGSITYAVVHTGLWLIEGQPRGIETRIAQLLRGGLTISDGRNMTGIP